MGSFVCASQPGFVLQEDVWKLAALLSSESDKLEDRALNGIYSGFTKNS